MRTAILIALSIPGLLGSPIAAQEHALPFDAPQVEIAVDSAPFQRLFDFDGDGDPDAVGGKSKGNAQTGYKTEVVVYVWRNDGQGRYTEILQELDAAPPFMPNLESVGTTSVLNEMRVAVGDFDGDGKQDFALGGGTELWIYHSNGDGSFARSISPLAATLKDAQAADFDGDGKSDLLILLPTSIELRWAAGGSTQAAYSSAFFNPIGHLRIAETDGDALPDFVLVGSSMQRIYSIQAGAISQGADFPLALGMIMVDSGDVDLDGDVDLVAFVAGVPLGEYAVLRRTGASSWSQEPFQLGGPAEYLADIDADGDSDGVCCGGGGGPDVTMYLPLDFNSTFELCRNDGTGAFEKAWTMMGLGSRSLAGARDVDLDGDVDLVAGRCVYFARGGLKPFPTAQFDSPPYEGAIFDWDQDGDPEPWRDSATQWYRNMGDGGFAWLPRVFELPAGMGYSSITGSHAYGDFNGDGYPDFVAHAFTPIAAEHLWINNGGGGFGYGGDAGAPPYGFNPASYSDLDSSVADLNADGDLDVVRRVPGFDATVLYTNDGAGHFALQETADGEQFWALGDLDLDGRIDAVVSSNSLQAQIEVRHGQAAGGSLFAPAQPELGALAFAGYPGLLIEMRDLNEDGHIDLAVVATGSVPTLCFNPLTSGAGGAWALSTLRIAAGDGAPAGVWAQDLNGDGSTDLLVGADPHPFTGPYGAQPHVIRCYTRKPSTAGVLSAASYEAPLMQVMPFSARLDADGDGDLDLLGGGLIADGGYSPKFGYVFRCTAAEGRGSGVRQQYGLGSAGSGGMIPNIGGSGPFMLGAAPAVKISGAVGGAKAFLAVTTWAGSVPSFPFPGMTTWLDPFAPGLVVVPIPLLGHPGQPGGGHRDIPVTLSAPLIGVPWRHQVFAIDLAAPYYVAASNGLLLQYGP